MLQLISAEATEPPTARETTMSKATIAPFLIAKDEEGQFRITVRETRFNSQNYPIVTSTLQPETFRSATAARTHAKQQFGAVTGEFASK